VNHSAANPEDVYASHYPKASTPSHGGQTAEDPSILKSPRLDSVGHYAAPEQTADFSRLLDIMLDLRRQQYGLEYDMNDLKKAFMATSVSLQEQLLALKTQVQTNVKGEDLQLLKETMANLEKTMNFMGEFQFVRLPKQP